MAEVTLSVLDRLIEAPSGRSTEQLLREYLKRDLEWLLNSRRVAVPLPESLDALRDSVYYYGLPDISSLSLDNPKDRARLQKQIERVISAFEPRLTNVHVTALEIKRSGTMTLRFEVQAVHKRDPAPERVSFDVMQLNTGEYQVKGDRSA